MGRRTPRFDHPASKLPGIHSTGPSPPSAIVSGGGQRNSRLPWQAPVGQLASRSGEEVARTRRLQASRSLRWLPHRQRGLPKRRAAVWGCQFCACTRRRPKPIVAPRLREAHDRKVGFIYPGSPYAPEHNDTPICRGGGVTT